MKKAILTLFAFLLFIPAVFAGPPPDVGGGVSGPQPEKKTKKWIGIEYGWYGPSLKTLNRTFSTPLGGKKIGTNDYIALGIGMPVAGDDRAGFFFGYWNGNAKQSGNTLNMNMLIFSGEPSFRIFKIKDKVHFRIGLVIRDIFGWWKFSGSGLDTSDFSISMDFGGKATAEFFLIPSLSIKLDFGRIFWGFMIDALIEPEKIKIETHGNILKFGLNLNY